MRSVKPKLLRLAGYFILMIPLGVNAATEQIVCPSLLMEQECRDYQVAQTLAQTEAERGLLADKYAALLKERSRLCQRPASLDAAEAVKGGLSTKRVRLFVGRKISM